MKLITRQLQAAGFLVNEFGRRYYIDADKAYLGLNYVTQGTAADLIKRGMNRVYELRKELIESIEGPTPIYIENLVHDELIMQVREDLLTPRLAGRINRALTTHVRGGKPVFNVPITAGCEVSEIDWAHARPYEMEFDDDGRSGSGAG